MKPAFQALQALQNDHLQSTLTQPCSFANPFRGCNAQQGSKEGRKTAPALQIVIITDSREQQALKFQNFPSEIAGLKTGDYSVKGFEDVFTVERKSISDLIGSLTAGRDRFFRELDRMQSYQFKRLLIVGTRSDIEAGNFRSKATPKSIIASLAVIECRHGVPIAFCSTPEEAARTVETWAYYFMREQAAQDATGTQGDHRDGQSITHDSPLSPAMLGAPQAIAKRRERTSNE